MIILLKNYLKKNNELCIFVKIKQIDNFIKELSYKNNKRNINYYMKFNFKNYINEIAYFLNENTDEEIDVGDGEENTDGENTDGEVQSTTLGDGGNGVVTPPSPKGTTVTPENGTPHPATQGNTISPPTAPTKPEVPSKQQSDISEQEVASAAKEAKAETQSFAEAFSSLEEMYTTLKNVMSAAGFKTLDEVKAAASKSENSGTQDGGEAPPSDGGGQPPAGGAAQPPTPQT